MTTALVALSLAVLLLAAALAAGADAARRRARSVEVVLGTALDERDQARAQAQLLRHELTGSGYRALIGQTVVASVTDGGSIRGILSAVYDDAIVIAHPVYVSGTTPAGIGSEVTLARSSVPMLQRFDEAS